MPSLVPAGPDHLRETRDDQRTAGYPVVRVRPDRVDLRRDDSRLDPCQLEREGGLPFCGARPAMAAVPSAEVIRPADVEVQELNRTTIE
jgi:hypothetical protein